MNKTAGIVVIGDEILSGKFADENASFAIGVFAELGVNLRRIAIIPDELDDIADTVLWFSERFDIVITSGGVGPTHDDLTMAGIARGFSTSVVNHPVLERLVREYWGPSMPEAALRLARVPDGAALVGSDPKWPVVCYRNVYILPGVPSLFRKKLTDIKDGFRGEAKKLARVYISSTESQFAPRLDQVASEFGDVKIGSYPRYEETEFQVLLTLESHDGAALQRCLDRLGAELGGWIVKIEAPA